jgi:glycosyltransferase involved in cell wall biosynthesis
MYLTGQDETLLVGWVAGSETLGRQSIFLSSWATELAKQGITPCVFCPREVVLGVNGVSRRHYAQPHRLRLGAGKMRNLIDVILDAGVDVLHALDASAVPQTVAAADRLAKPYFISCYRRGARLHLPHKARHPAGVLAASESIRRDLCKHHIAPEEVIHLQRPGVWIACDPKDLEFQDRRAMVLADVYDASNGNTEVVLKSFADVRRRDGGAMFFLLHSSRQERLLRRRAEALGLLSDITFMAEDDGGRAMHVVQSADVFIAAGARKEFNWGALLAMAAGAPVVAVRSDENDFLSDGMTASLFSPGDAEALSALLMNMLTTPAWGRAQARSALQYLHVYHNPLRGVTNLANLYRAAVTQEETVTAVEVERKA